MIRRLLVISIAIAAGAAPAAAQVSVSGGLEWAGGYGIGASAAELRTNAPGASPPPFTLFEVDSRIDAAPGGEVRVTVPLTRQLSVEGGVHFARRRLGFAISGDPEAAAQQFEGESLQQYVFDGAVLWELPQRLQGRRFRVSAIGGAAYLRQLHQDRTLVEHGQLYSAGGSLRYWLRGTANAARSAGIRSDLRINVRRHGIDFADAVRVYPTASILMFWMF